MCRSTDRLNDRDRQVVKQHLAQCPLCAEAVEGFQTVGDEERLRTAVEELNEQLAKETGLPTSSDGAGAYFLRIAAVLVGVIALAGGAWLVLENGGPSPQVADQKAVETEATDKSKPPVAASEALDEEAAFYDMLKEDEAATATHPDQAYGWESDLSAGTGSGGLALKQKSLERYKKDSQEEAKEATAKKETDADQLAFQDVPAAESEERKKGNNKATGEMATGGGIGRPEAEIQTTMLEPELALAEEATEGVDDQMLLEEEAEEAPAMTRSKKEARQPKAGVSANATRKAQTEALEVPAGPTKDSRSSEPDVFTSVERMPQFPGGQEALNAYLQNNLKYPRRAAESEAEGTVYIKFVVDEKGRVKDAEVMRGIQKDLDREALKTVKSMPDWEPGKGHGQAVPVQMTLPVKFELPEE